MTRQKQPVEIIYLKVVVYIRFTLWQGNSTVAGTGAMWMWIWKQDGKNQFHLWWFTLFSPERLCVVVCSGKRITLIKFKLCAEIQVNRLAKRNSLNRSEMLTHWRAVFGVCVRVSGCPVHSTSTSIANEKLLQFTFGCLNNNHPLVLSHALTSFTRAFIIHLGKDFPISFIWRFINAFSPLLYQKKCQHFNHTRYKFRILGPLLMSEPTFTETGTHIHTLGKSELE